MGTAEWAILVTVFLTLAGAFWALVRHGLQRMQDKIDEHSQRLSVLETDNTSNKIELQRLRDMRHDILEKVSQSSAALYMSVVKLLTNKGD